MRRSRASPRWPPTIPTTSRGCSARKPSSAPLNVSGYRSERFEALARRTASAPDLARRQRATKAELELLTHDAPAIALFYSQGAFAYRAAIYDGWAFVKGSGILDKRSFLPGATAAATPPPATDDTALEEEDSGSGLALLNVISLVVLAIVVALAAIALVLRGRSRS